VASKQAGVEVGQEQTRCVSVSSPFLCLLCVLGRVGPEGQHSPILCCESARNAWGEQGVLAELTDALAAARRSRRARNGHVHLPEGGTFVILNISCGKLTKVNKLIHKR